MDWIQLVIAPFGGMGGTLTPVQGPDSRNPGFPYYNSGNLHPYDSIGVRDSIRSLSLPLPSKFILFTGSVKDLLGSASTTS